MARVAIVAGPDPGHALPALGLGAALARAGHEVRCWSGAGHDATAASVGIGLERLPLLAPHPDDADLGFRLWGRGAQMAVPLATQLAGFRPDLVVADVLTRCGQFAAQLLEVPWVELTPHHLDEPDDDLPPVGLGRQPARHALRRADDRRLVRHQRRSRALGSAQATRAARSIGLHGAAVPVHRLIGTVRGLEYPRRRWPPDTTWVGPLALDPVGPPLEPPPGRAPLIVVTDSTATDVSRSLGARAITALRGCDVRLVVTSGWLPAQRAPGLVVGTGPHGPLLAEADVAVSPGGFGFVGKAVGAGVPTVTVPFQGDQRETAARLVWQGAGRALPLRRGHGWRLRTAIRRVGSDGATRAAARQLAAEVARTDDTTILRALAPWLGPISRPRTG